MSADSDNTNDKYVAELASLESRLHGHDDDEAMLVEVGVAMRSLLSGNGERENHIRDLLQKQYDSGHLRKETYELVQNLLGKIVTEELARAPLPDSASVGDDLFAQTAVIEDQAQAQNEAKTPAPAPAPLKPEPDPVRAVNVGSLLRDRFLLKEKVSEGSMGVVYKALDKRLAEADDENVFVAIKVLSAELSRNGPALRALQQEAAKGRCLTHPNIVRFIDLDREDDLYFIVMEWLEGKSLARILDGDRGNVLDWRTASDIIRQTARALDYAHQRGVVHADVKPGNIIITPAGDVKLIDFGVARVRQKENEGKSRFDPGVLRAGTPAYSSMQVLTGEDPVPADDVFSLACLMYRLIAGYRVYGPRNAAQAAEDGMEPQRPQGLEDQKWQPLKKALSYSRVTRFDSASAFVKALGIKALKSPASKTAGGESAGRSAEPVAPIADEPGPVEKPEKVAPPDIRSEKAPPSVKAKAPVMTPFRAESESIMYARDDDDDDDDDEVRRSPWRLAVIGIILVASAAIVVTRTDLVDQIGSRVETIGLTPVADVFDDEPEIIDVPPVDETTQDIAEFNPAVAADGVDSESMVEPAIADDDPARGEPAADNSVAFEEDGVLVPDDLFDEIEPGPPATDYSTLPPATLTINLGTESQPAPASTLTIREGGEVPIIDVFRTDVSLEQTIVINETSFTGNRSPLATGQYAMENGGRLQFAAGQERARLSITTRSNPVREPDRDVELRLVDEAKPDQVLASINLTLEDDDQRAFERGLPVNTVAFAVNQISVREFDPAAQIDVIRYNADDTALEVPYVLHDVTATEGQDYFTPGSTIIYFAAGQRTARILVPLGQDARAESDEAFMLELEVDQATTDSNLFSQIAVMIRDDDS